MSYVDEVIQPDEAIRARGRVHWVVYLLGMVSLVLGLAIYIDSRQGTAYVLTLDLLAVVLVAAGIVLILRAWLHQLGTEIVVTDKRVIYKRGLVRRRSIEMSMDKVESVEVIQSILGRLMGFGTVEVRGTGETLEKIRKIAHPLALRAAITAR